MLRKLVEDQDSQWIREIIVFIAFLLIMAVVFLVRLQMKEKEYRAKVAESATQGKKYVEIDGPRVTAIYPLND